MVTIEVATESVPGGAISQVFEIGPTGIQFAVPVTIEIAYDQSELHGTDPSSLSLATLSAGAWAPVWASTVSTAPPVVAGLTTHLSLYAIVPATAKPCTCHVTAAETCCKQFGGTFAGSEQYCSCTGPGFAEYVTCYAKGSGSLDTTNFCNSSELKACCTKAGGTPALSCTCLTDSSQAVANVETCARTTLSMGVAPSICTAGPGSAGGAGGAAGSAGAGGTGGAGTIACGSSTGGSSGASAIAGSTSFSKNFILIGNVSQTDGPTAQQPPEKYLKEQGQVLDSSCAPVTSKVKLTFTLYNAATSTPGCNAPNFCLWTESQNISLNMGNFSAMLGSNVPIPPGLLDGSSGTLFLGITVGADGELSPRQVVPSP
jgi:hypothetical protein